MSRLGYARVASSRSSRLLRLPGPLEYRSIPGKESGFAARSRRDSGAGSGPLGLPEEDANEANEANGPEFVAALESAGISIDEAEMEQTDLHNFFAQPYGLN